MQLAPAWLRCPCHAPGLPPPPPAKPPTGPPTWPAPATPPACLPACLLQLMAQPPYDEKLAPYYILHYTYGAALGGAPGAGCRAGGAGRAALRMPGAGCLVPRPVPHPRHAPLTCPAPSGPLQAWTTRWRACSRLVGAGPRATCVRALCGTARRLAWPWLAAGPLLQACPGAAPSAPAAPSWCRRLPHRHRPSPSSPPSSCQASTASGGLTSGRTRASRRRATWASRPRA